MDLSHQLSAQRHKPDVHFFRSSNKAKPRLYRSVILSSQSLHMIQCHQSTSHDHNRSSIHITAVTPHNRCMYFTSRMKIPSVLL
jgi:hypothetical protein